MVDFNWDDAKTGAAVGAVGGTAVEPGLGTAVGAVGGGLIGGFSGFGGGLFGTLAGASNPNARWEQEAGARVGETQNIDTLKGWANAGQKDQYGNPVYHNIPSAAQDLLERNRSTGQERALSNAKAMAGGNPALAAQMANRQQAQVSADSSLQSATLRAQEQQNAMQAYQQALQTRREQDISQASALSGLDQKNAEKKADFITSIGHMAGGML